MRILNYAKYHRGGKRDVNYCLLLCNEFLFFIINVYLYTTKIY